MQLVKSGHEAGFFIGQRNGRALARRRSVPRLVCVRASGTGPHHGRPLGTPRPATPRCWCRGAPTQRPSAPFRLEALLLCQLNARGPRPAALPGPWRGPCRARSLLPGRPAQLDTPSCPRSDSAGAAPLQTARAKPAAAARDGCRRSGARAPAASRAAGPMTRSRLLLTRRRLRLQGGGIRPAAIRPLASLQPYVYGCKEEAASCAYLHRPAKAA